MAATLYTLIYKLSNYYFNITSTFFNYELVWPVELLQAEKEKQAKKLIANNYVGNMENRRTSIVQCVVSINRRHTVRRHTVIYGREIVSILSRLRYPSPQCEEGRRRTLSGTNCFMSMEFFDHGFRLIDLGGTKLATIWC